VLDYIFIYLYITVGENICWEWMGYELRT